MKYFVMCLFIGIVYAQSQEEMMRQYAMQSHNECVLETSVSEADLESLKGGTLPDSKEAKCFMGCMADKFGLITDGAFDRAKTEANIKKHTSGADQEKYLGYMEHCSKIATSSEKCETGGQLFTCLKDQGALEAGILPSR